MHETSEDFSFYQKKIPGAFVFVGVRNASASMGKYAPNHSPRFKIYGGGPKLGVRLLANMAVDYAALAH